MNEGESYNCPDCDDKLKAERGCETKGIMPCFYYQETIYQCPLKVITPLSWEYLRAYSLYQKSILPQNKGWVEENDKFLQAMSVVDAEAKRIEIEMTRKKN
jgi:hypothetical protein